MRLQDIQVGQSYKAKYFVNEARVVGIVLGGRQTDNIKDVQITRGWRGQKEIKAVVCLADGDHEVSFSSETAAPFLVVSNVSNNQLATLAARKIEEPWSTYHERITRIEEDKVQAKEAREALVAEIYEVFGFTDSPDLDLDHRANWRDGEFSDEDWEAELDALRDWNNHGVKDLPDSLSRDSLLDFLKYGNSQDERELRALLWAYRQGARQ